MSEEPLVFDVGKFQATQFKPREKAVLVSDLAPFFSTNGKKADPKKTFWTVRGLTAEELARVNEASTGETQKRYQAMMELLTTMGKHSNMDGLEKWLGISDDSPQEYVRRLEMLIAGSVEPKTDRALAVRLADAFPIEFLRLTNTITELTGLGKQWGEPSDSGQTLESESH